MRVLLARSEYVGSSYYRVDEPARAVAEADRGADVTVRTGLATIMRRGTDDTEAQVVEVDAEGADVVVLQLPKTTAMLQILRLLQAQGVAVVVEIDDLLTGVPFGHMAHGSLVRSGHGDVARQCAREADLVTVTTPALLDEYARHGRGVVVPNAIPRRIAELPPAYERDPEVVTIGWTGNVLGHPYDLQEMGSGLQQALDRTRSRSRLLVIGQKWDLRERLGLSTDPDEHSWLDSVDTYAARVGELLDVGIAPLRLDRFNACKSWLKPLEYSARGVYCVRARSAEYERLGLGVPARAPKDWAKWIAAGVQDADRRREVAAAAHQEVLARHLTEHTVERWVAAWRTALDNSARRSGAGRRDAVRAS
ncbi:glycosyltransferase family protein [Blastococcus brunescens]|uniref:Glycosyltransferase n=1 Tax=Blastococcus brunescens TaxID=1564165 RepID=A0ABZ1B1V9_9ACTN|nr:glycosyltransferase [Blastococcus sp. BMG 8361]WRL64796.1 glycosyltransferase [Blastococcus sp. BMG 8361]